MHCNTKTFDAKPPFDTHQCLFATFSLSKYGFSLFLLLFQKCIGEFGIPRKIWPNRGRILRERPRDRGQNKGFPAKPHSIREEGRERGEHWTRGCSFKGWVKWVFDVGGQGLR